MRKPAVVSGGLSVTTWTRKSPPSLRQTPDKPQHRCKICPLCRCHHDCRPELAEAVDRRG